MMINHFRIRQTVSLLFLLIFELFCDGYSLKAQPYQDVTHYSQVFNKQKTYRLYLPDNYKLSVKKYPVIYFFHGWGGRYYKDDSAKLAYDKLGDLVNKYQVILVMWDGNMDESEPRPYNIGNHNDVKFDIQMKDYFPELVTCIDSTYRTFTDRNHRGIIGFSMGGIMSFYIAGKYPDRVSAAVNMVGSPEFFIGLPENHTLYQVRYTFDNLRDVGLLFHNRDSCQMTGLNDEVNQGAIWSGLKNYEYHKLKGGHKVDDPGETKVFESAVRFVTNQFEKPASLNPNWSHYDLCPDFSLWGYSVKSNKAEPGFLFLRHVDACGFGFYTKKWLPEGPTLKNIKADISTAPVYEPNVVYQIHIYNQKDKHFAKFETSADQNGRLHLQLTGEGFEIGISKKGEQPSFVSSGYQLTRNRKFLRANVQDEISVNIFKQGGTNRDNTKLSVTLSCADSSVIISTPKQEISFQEGEDIFQTKPIKIYTDKTPPSDGSPEILRIQVGMDYETLHFNDFFLLPVFYDVPYFTNIQVDDGRQIAKNEIEKDANRTVADSIFGTGNGDGNVSAGEQIMLYQNGHRLRLYTDDPYVIAGDEKLFDEVLPAVWPDGYTLSSVVKIADNCPAGHEIEFMAHYETKTYMPIHRIVKWGKVIIKVAPR